MGLIPRIELAGRSTAPHERVPNSASPVEKLIELSSWMMVLGTIRLICTFADYANAYLEASRLEPMSLRQLSWFIQENHPIVALSAAWPLVLGIALRRTRWPELLTAGAATFLILSIGGVLAATADWNQSSEKWITLGSFHIARSTVLRPSLPDIALGLLGATQLVFELWTAVRAIFVAFHAHAVPGSPLDKPTVSRRARFGRLAVYTSLAYLVLMIRLPVWSAYIEVLNHSRFIREFVLQSDFQRIRTTRHPVRSTPELERVRDFQFLLANALDAWRAGEFLEAKDKYLRLVDLMETMPPSHHSGAFVLNNLAWLLATCPEVTLRHPQNAVSYARRAVAMVPDDGNSWNTLGVAYYRAANWEEARNALYRSMELRDDGDSFDWFFLAMIHVHLGHQERARQWYDKASEWSRHYRPGDAELYRFQVEAAQVLGLPKPEPPPPPPQEARPPSLPVNPLMIHRRGRSRLIDPGMPGLEPHRSPPRSERGPLSVPR